MSEGSPGTPVCVKSVAQDEGEPLQVVDVHDRPLASRPRSEVHAMKLLHRGVHVLVFNRAGDLVVQRRSASKDLWPGYWDSSSSGHVNPGETYEHAAQRELKEELGIEPRLQRTGRLEACAETNWEFIEVFAAMHDGPVHPNAAEIDEVRLLPMSQLRAKILTQRQSFTPPFVQAFHLYASSSPTMAD